MIESTYIELIQEYEVNTNSATELWSEISTNYSKSSRYYHNLEHLEDLHSQLTNEKSKIENWQVILFTLFYHDIVYKSTKKDNEEKSAELALKRMTQIGVNKKHIKLCFDQIIATKTHEPNPNSDTNFFTDADLSILGRESSQYKIYCKNIRKEYSIYSDFLYNKGRKKVINHFLSMDSIFKTDEFNSQYERQARKNLKAELESLK